MFTVTLALRKWAPKLEGKNIVVYCDNLSSVELMMSGKSHCKLMLQSLREVAYIAAKHQINIKAKHIEGVKNTLPDLLSRFHLSQKYVNQFLAETSNQELVEIEITKHGENISSEGAISAEEFLDSFSESDSMKVKFLAEIDEVCSKKGCWMTLNLDEERTILVRFKDYEFFVPKDAAGKTAVIEGFATIDTLSISEQKHYLSDANASQEEIDAVIEPEITYAFEATGVIIKGEK